MLYLTRKLNESIIINSNIEVKIIEVKGMGQGATVKLGFEFPKEASVLRKEVFDKVVYENIAASKSTSPDSQEDFLAALDELQKSMEEPAFTTQHTSSTTKTPKVVVKKSRINKDKNPTNS